MKTYFCDSCSLMERSEDLPEGWTNDEFYLCPACTRRRPDFCPHCVAASRDVKDPPIWLSGMTCLTCGVGHYEEGYTDDDKVLPCTVCGAQEPVSLPRSVIRYKIEHRDPKYIEEYIENFVKTHGFV